MARRPFAVLQFGIEGGRAFRLALPWWVVIVAVGGVAIGASLVGSSVGAMYRDYVSLSGQRAALSVLLEREADQQALLDSYQTRVRELRGEIAGWREIHARILEPFGPDAGLSRRDPGIGGGTAASPLDGDGDRADVREELARLSRLVAEESDNLHALEQFLARAGKVLATLPSRWPLLGPLNSDYGRRTSPWASSSEFHSGIDIGAAVGSAVRAPAPGVVVFAGRLPEYGIALVIDHGNDTKSLYGHLSKVLVSADEKVQRGDVVAFTGNTGRSSGPHLHYEIQVKGEPVNPNTYLWD